MVALSGRGWVLAPCLVDLVEETDRRCPGRSTASDGSIGDPAHQDRVSDHNPADGYVHALDLTDDDNHGCDITLLFAHLVASRDRRVKYLIHKGTIWKSYESHGLKPWTPQVYTGTNAHKLHGHISVKDGQENTPGPWWPTSKPTVTPSLEVEDMAVVIRRIENPNQSVLIVPDKTSKIGVRGFYAEATSTAGNEGIIGAQEVKVDKGAWDRIFNDWLAANGAVTKT